MPGKDEISTTTSKDYALRTNDAEVLKVGLGYKSSPSPDLPFGGLRNRFVTRLGKQENGDVVPVERGFGEAWELADRGGKAATATAVCKWVENKNPMSTTSCNLSAEPLRLLGLVR